MLHTSHDCYNIEFLFFSTIQMAQKTYLRTSFFCNYSVNELTRTLQNKQKSISGIRKSNSLAIFKNVSRTYWFQYLPNFWFQIFSVQDIASPFTCIRYCGILEHQRLGRNIVHDKAILRKKGIFEYFPKCSE